MTRSRQRAALRVGRTVTVTADGRHRDRDSVPGCQAQQRRRLCAILARGRDLSGIDRLPSPTRDERDHDASSTDCDLGSPGRSRLLVTIVTVTLRPGPGASESRATLRPGVGDSLHRRPGRCLTNRTSY
jgi:hypothetical protein